MMAPTVCFPAVADNNSFIFFDTFSNLEYWKLWWWWPDKGGCTEGFVMMYVLCVVRWVLIAASII